MSIDYIQLKLGPMDNFVYIIYHTTTRNGFIVDPAWEPDSIIAALNQHDITPLFCLLTHGHHDHHSATRPISETYNIPTYLSKREVDTLTETVYQPTLIDDLYPLKLDNTTIRMIATPGHTPGGTCFIIDQLIITGDTLFINGCGRCDFGSGDLNDMYASLQLLKTLPDDLTVLPGHDYGKTTTASLGSEKKTNRFMVCPNIAAFIRKRSA